MTRILMLGVLSLGLTCLAVGHDRDEKGQHDRGWNDKGGGGDPVSVPEPSQVVSAVALLGGSALVLRRRRKH